MAIWVKRQISLLRVEVPQGRTSYMGMIQIKRPCWGWYEAVIGVADQDMEF